MARNLNKYMVDLFVTTETKFSRFFFIYFCNWIIKKNLCCPNLLDNNLLMGMYQIISDWNVPYGRSRHLNEMCIHLKNITFFDPFLTQKHWSITNRVESLDRLIDGQILAIFTSLILFSLYSGNHHCISLFYSVFCPKSMTNLNWISILSNKQFFPVFKKNEIKNSHFWNASAIEKNKRTTRSS